jgi:hypothetical protein
MLPPQRNRWAIVVAKCYEEEMVLGSKTYNRWAVVRGLAYLDAVGILVFLLAVLWLGDKCVLP